VDRIGIIDRRVTAEPVDERVGHNGRPGDRMASEVRREVQNLPGRESATNRNEGCDKDRTDEKHELTPAAESTRRALGGWAGASHQNPYLLVCDLLSAQPTGR